MARFCLFVCFFSIVCFALLICLFAFILYVAGFFLLFFIYLFIYLFIYFYFFNFPFLFLFLFIYFFFCCFFAIGQLVHVGCMIKLGLHPYLAGYCFCLSNNIV